ncbi:MAG TPA: hypothetical protein PKK05_28050 [Leptospiraceae bacterium]|nr:hypothetical protein [Leptospiraceae bacterium]
MKTYHFYNQETFEYIRTEEVKPGRIPKNAVETAVGKPESLQEGERLIWSIAQNQWIVLTEKQFTEMLIGLGVKSKSEKQKVSDDGRIVDMAKEELIQSGFISLKSLKEQKIDEISDICGRIIVSGFESKAKGEVYIYDTKIEDQLYIKSLMDFGKDAEIRCRRKSDGIKKHYPHTTSQIAQIVGEFAVRLTSLLKKADEFRNEIEAMKDPLAVYNYKMVWE